MRAAKLIDDSRSHPFAAQSSCSAGALRIDRLVPYGGPHHGGTEVMVRLSGGTGFFDLGDAKCAFGGTAVPAQSLNSSVLRCTSPAVELADEEFLGALPARSTSVNGPTLRAVPLEISLDGVAFTSSQRLFTFFDSRLFARITAIEPNIGPRFGGTLVHVTARGLVPFGTDRADAPLGLACIFGGADWVAANPAGSLDYLHCRSPLESTVTVLVLILAY